jgi:hypothetical protein
MSIESAAPMKKFSVYVLIIFVAMVMAGFFGMAHDQISYTAAPEYFTKFKFRQFGFETGPLPERLRASLIGFLASWWMGLPIGLLVGAAGFIHPGAGRMFRVTVQSLWVTVGFTLMVGLAGLIYGYFRTRQIHLEEYQDWFIPEDVTELRRYLCAGYMHNSSYLGGALGIFAAWAYQWTAKLRYPAQISEHSPKSN